MNKAQKAVFRKSDKWKRFRAKCRLHTSKDYLTGAQLARSWNLHHMDLRHEKYDDLSDMSRFLPLNSKSHDLVHYLWPVWKKDRRVLDRLREILERMEEYTSGYTSDSQEDR